MTLAQAVDGDRQRPVGQHHLDRHLVEPHLGVDVTGDPHVAGEQHERAGGERVTGAGGHDGHRGAVESVHERSPVGDEADDVRHVVAEHHTEVEARRELARTSVQHQRADLLVGFGLVDRRVDGGDHVERQRIGLAVVEMHHEHGVASFGRHCWRAHAAEPMRPTDDIAGLSPDVTRRGGRGCRQRTSAPSRRRRCARGSGRSTQRVRRRRDRPRRPRPGGRSSRRHRWQSPAR